MFNFSFHYIKCLMTLRMPAAASNRFVHLPKTSLYLSKQPAVTLSKILIIDMNQIMTDFLLHKMA